VPLEDTVNIYKFYLNLRHTTSYRYANIYLFINTTFPDGTAARDTVECILADPSGKWVGKGISNILDNQVLLRRGLRFPQKGKYIFEFEQAMREPELEGVMDIGLRITRE
jgi:gliding motility-associated lipoprotein GldH